MLTHRELTPCRRLLRKFDRRAETTLANRADADAKGDLRHAGLVLSASLARLGRETDGSSAIEFAFITPIMLLLMISGYELSAAITASNRATYVAEAIGQVVSQAQATVSTADMTAYIKTAALVDRDVINYANATGTPLETAVNVTVSSVVFTPQIATCTSNCTYDAKVVFSEALAGTKRACGTLAPGAGYSAATLPPAVYSPTSLVVVDVEVFYRPLMTSVLGQKISFKRSSFFAPRYVDHINYANNCAGYPNT